MGAILPCEESLTRSTLVASFEVFSTSEDNLGLDIVSNIEVAINVGNG